MYQYSNTAPRLSGQNRNFLKFLLSLNSQKRLGYKENNTKYRSLSWNPRSNVGILIYRMWPIVKLSVGQITLQVEIWNHSSKGVKVNWLPQNDNSYFSDTADAALPRLGVCWSVTDWVDSFRVLLLRSGLESVCDRSLRDPWDPEACKEFWEPNLPLRTGMDGTAKPLCSAVFDWSVPLWLTNQLNRVNGWWKLSKALATFCYFFNWPEPAIYIEVA